MGRKNIGRGSGKYKVSQDNIIELSDDLKKKIGQQAEAKALGSFVTYEQYKADCIKYISNKGFRGEAPNFFKELKEAYDNYTLYSDFGDAYILKYGSTKQTDKGKV